MGEQLIYKEIKFNTPATNMELKFRGRKTVVGRNSASGKTYVCQLISRYRDYTKSKNILVFDTESDQSMDLAIDFIKNKTGNLIVLDNADRLAIDHPEITGYVYTDTKNQYLIMSRIPYFSLDSQDWAEMIYDNKSNTLKLSYRFPTLFGEH